MNAPRALTGLAVGMIAAVLASAACAPRGGSGAAVRTGGPTDAESARQAQTAQLLAESLGQDFDFNNEGNRALALRYRGATATVLPTAGANPTAAQSAGVSLYHAQVSIALAPATGETGPTVQVVSLDTPLRRQGTNDMPTELGMNPGTPTAPNTYALSAHCRQRDCTMLIVFLKMNAGPAADGTPAAGATPIFPIVFQKNDATNAYAVRWAFAGTPRQEGATAAQARQHFLRGASDCSFQQAVETMARFAGGDASQAGHCGIAAAAADPAPVPPADPAPVPPTDPVPVPPADPAPVPPADPPPGPR